MTELKEGDELRLMMGGEVVGTGYVLPDGNASFQLDSGAVAWVGSKLVRGYSIEPEPAEPPCLCDYEHIRMGDEVVRTRWMRDPACKFPHKGGRLAGGPSPSVEPVAGRPCGCVPGEECMVCRNWFAFRRETFPAIPANGHGPFHRANWEAVQDELAVDLRGEPRPGFVRAPYPGDLPFPVRVDTEVRPGVVRLEAGEQRVDIEVQALACSTSSHAGTVPAVVWGQFRVPWWSEERAEPAAYCASCARVLGFMGYFTPDEAGA
ncbi:hypothetical protein SEA_TAYLORSIPHT_60 [Arthrobacter phage TaylorSipht]|nr:hypothetical protein SEA_TAYLORSIPHT_60 [Arthrobacter phage TaylorSipht]